MQRDSAYAVPFGIFCGLQNLDVFRLQAFGPLGDGKTYCLVFLQAAETIGLDRAEMHENIFAVFASDKSKTFCVIEPLNFSLFHIDTRTLFLI